MFDAESFSTHLESDFTWRIRELSDLKSGVKGSDTAYQSTLRRAALPLIYAHWEGHVRFVAEAYLKYVSKRKLPVQKIPKNLAVVALHGFFEQFLGRNIGYEERITLIGKFQDYYNSQFKNIPKNYVNTGGNLGFERFCDLCIMIGVDGTVIIENGDYLNKNILEKRNFIAHGSDKTVDPDELNKLVEFVIEAMRSFRDQVINLVVLERYKI